MESSSVDVSLRSSSDYYNSAYTTVITVYIIIAVVLVVLTVGGCIIVCICGRPKTIPGRVHYPPTMNMAQGIIPAAPPLTCVASPGTYPVAYQSPSYPPAANATEKGSPPPCYDDATNTAFVNPIYHA